MDTQCYDWIIIIHKSQVIGDREGRTRVRLTRNLHMGYTWDGYDWSCTIIPKAHPYMRGRHTSDTQMICILF